MRRGQEREKEKKRRENIGEREKNTGGRFETTENKHRDQLTKVKSFFKNKF